MRARRPPAAARHGARAPQERSLTGRAAARFVGSYPRADTPLDPPLPEVALLGRSNVGKSSLLNALVGQRIARTSGTPGKTRMLNVYELQLRGEWCVVPPGATRDAAVPGRAPLTTHHALYVLDLPGYGYAKVSHAERAAFRALLAGVLARPRLTGVVWLLDLRREPSAEDGAMQDTFAAGGVRVLAALTKADKLSRGEGAAHARTLRDALRLDADQVVTTSAKTREGVSELRAAIAGLLEGQERS
jgi:GTP-binding protein